MNTTKATWAMIIGACLLLVFVIGDLFVGKSEYHPGIVEGKYDGWDDDGYWYEFEVEVYGSYLNVSVNRSTYNRYRYGDNVSVSQYYGGWTGIVWKTSIH